MAKLIYTAITSLDGFVEDSRGSFDWARPDDEVHAYVNDLQRAIGTHLYGRRICDVMRYWEDPPRGGDLTSVPEEFAAIWQAADKVVYSTTLERPLTRRTRLEPAFEPEAVRQLKASCVRDLAVGGAAWPPLRSRQDWSTNTICSSCRSLSGGANLRCPRMSG